MIAVDSSSWIAFFSERAPRGDDTILVESALRDRQACLPPAVPTELLSDPKLPAPVAGLLTRMPVLEVPPGSWQRVGRTRSKLVARRRRARLADALIAQRCVDHGVRLVTRDDDLEAFVRPAGLRLAL